MNDYSGLLFLFVGPAVIGVGALLGAGVLIARRKTARQRGGDGPSWIGIGLLLLIAFGIGSCYAVLFLQ